MFWHAEWGRLRNEPPRADREWLRFAELLEVCRAEGVQMSPKRIRRIVRSVGMPEKRYGHYRYESRHLAAVRAFADREGLIRKEAT